ncbi:hypothetical protein HK097_003132 [Rhizophlyctis rosea]|uniref:Prenylcysteine lyase domain-containing protein n=1 Tax=Rhizophlyctis rosea TaxID=64517 RepID=A0AAD5X6X3_9FUNG|nr:hypothetical protein HK097_003132 [Rhizophlyctis rosea]
MRFLYGLALFAYLGVSVGEVLPDSLGEDDFQQVLRNWEDPGVSQTSLWSPPLLRVAIIGAGAAGTSTAYFLRKLEKSHPLSSQSTPIKLTLYERTERIGGRARVLPLNVTVCTPDSSICAPELQHIELGASVFAAKNHHLVNASRELNLTLEDLSKFPGKDRVGVWDGEKWRIRQTGTVGHLPGTDGWLGDAFDKAKILARYGLFHGPLQAAKICRDIAARFFSIYDKLLARDVFERVDLLVKELALWDTVSTSSLEYFRDSKGINEAFVTEFIGGITKNTYLQEIAKTSAFGGAIALYSGTNDLFHVKGGNYQIYQRMVQDEDVKLKNSVESVERVEKDGRTTFVVEGQDHVKKMYDVVVVAAPLPASEIKFQGISVEKFPPLRYVQLYVTIIVGTFNPAYFGLDSHSDIPEGILVPSESTSQTIPTVPFFTMGKTDISSSVSIVKFFSPKPISDSVLDDIFSTREQTHRHAWDLPGSYPYLPVRDEEWEVPVEVEAGVYYVNAMESWISTMETETVAGRNVANLIWRRWEKELERRWMRASG